MGAERAREPLDSPWRTKEEGAFVLRTILWCVDRLRAPIAYGGVDFPRFRELLRTRFVLTERATSASSKAWSAAGTVIAIVMTCFFGLLTGLIALGEDGSTWVLVSQSVAMLMLSLLLFQVLAGVLVDPTDIAVVAPHPISDRTVFAVRLAEVTAYVLIFVVSFTGANVLLAVLRQPPLAVLFVYPLLALLAGAVTLGLVTLLFALCLRVVGPTYFQRVTLWLQILGGFAIFASLQAAQIVGHEQWRLWLERYGHLRVLWPPQQYADLFAWACGRAEEFPALEALAAVLAPLAALSVTFWLASRYFVAGLQGSLSAPVKRAGWQRGLLSGLGARLRRREERAGFDFALALARREPHFLRAVLPQLLMFQAMMLGSAFGLKRQLGYYIPGSAAFLFMVLPNVLLQAQGTPVPDARELFRSAPLEDENALLRGSVKALLLQWIGLPSLLLFVIQLWASGPGALPRIVLAFELSFTMTLVFTRLFQLGVPFTQAIRVGSASAANLGMVLLLGFGMLVVVGIHALLSLHPIALGCGIVAFAVVLVVLWRQMGRLKVTASQRLLVPGSHLVIESKPVW